MNKDDIKLKIDQLNSKIKDLSDKTKDIFDSVKIIGLEAQDKIDDSIKETKGNINALKENYKLLSEKTKNKISSEILKIQMNLESAKTEIASKKDLHDKEKFEKYIEDIIEYSNVCVNISMLAAEEAKLAKLEAIKAQIEYDKKYKE